jgi:predicted membrane protein
MDQQTNSNSNTDKRWTRENFRRSRHRHGGAITGVFLVLIGAGLLINKMNPELPNWIFSWKTLLIVIGLYIGAKHNFRSGGWFVPIIVGTVFLVIENFPDLAIRPYIWPIAIITVGLIIILKPKMFRARSSMNQDGYDDDNKGYKGHSWNDDDASFTSEDVIESTNIFSGSKKINLSKNFRGGEITNVFGGSELNLTKADIKGRVVLEVTCIFGGTKLIVPPDWNIQQEAVAIFGGIDDKRPITGMQDSPDKILVIKGTVLMGGIDIRSY